MRLLSLAGLVLAVFVAAVPAAIAGNDDPLFLNLTTDDSHRATMALGFVAKQQERKHPISILVNDRAVNIVAKSKADTFGEHQKLIAQIVKAGGTVLVCQMCMKHYGVEASDLIDGVKLSGPDLAGAELFKDDSRTLTW